MRVRAVRTALGTGLVGLLAFLALYAVLGRSVEERGRAAEGRRVVELLVQVQRIGLSARASVQAPDQSRRAAHLDEAEEALVLAEALVFPDGRGAGIADGAGRRSTLAAELAPPLISFLLDARDVIVAPEGAAPPDRRLIALADQAAGPVFELLDHARIMLAERGEADAERRQSTVILVLILFFAGLVAGAGVILRRSNTGAENPRRARAGSALASPRQDALPDLMSALDGLDEGVALFDEVDTLVWCNARYWDLYAVPDGPNAPGSGYGDLLRGRVAAGFYRDARGSEEAWAASRLERHRHPEGPEKEFLSDGRCLQVAEYRVVGGGTVCLVADVTEAERRDAARQVGDARTRATLAAVFDGIVTFTDEGRIEGLNPAAESIFGHAAADVVGESVRVLMPESYAGVSDGEVAAFLAGGIGPYLGTVHEVDGRRRDGTVFPLEVAVEELPDSWSLHERRRSRRRFFIASVRDITERRELAGQLQQSQKMQAIGTLAGGIAHDFNNILSVILGYTGLVLDEQGLDGEARENLETVLQAGRRARDLVDQILTFSRRSERVKLPVALRPTVEEVLKLMRSTLPATVDIRTEFAIDGNRVLADSSQIHQVMMNLCTNAGQAMAGAGGTLTVGLRSMPLDDLSAQRLGVAPGRYLSMSVRDTGKGMDRATLERVFEPFFTTKERGEGTGLGLSVVHGIVADHGGAIAVDSSPGVGSVFEVYLPELVDPHGASTVATDRADAVAARGSGRILFVDDETAVVRMAEKVLRRLGYDVVGTDDSRRALATFREDPGGFDLVVTDNTMPGLAGEGLIRELRAIRADVPIVMCTGYASGPSAERIRDLRVDGFIEKPTLADTLPLAIRDILAIRRGAG
jgi:PAS domain S-box-containing protein